MDYLVKLDTNGTNPNVIEELKEPDVKEHLQINESPKSEGAKTTTAGLSLSENDAENLGYK